MNNLNNLVTTYNFRGKEYLVSLNSPKLNPGNMEIKVTDKRTVEEWLGSFSASYIENLTQKTGNYKRFDTFIAMVKSGLLSTSQCVTLDLLTFEDLEMLKSKKHQVRNFSASYSSNISAASNNRRYLIVTYTVEFDRIHFPLALEYCGPPDPKILQETILRLEKQVVHLQQQLDGNNWEDISSQIDSLQRKVVEVTSENIMLKEHLNSMQKSKYSLKHTDSYLKTIHSLENKLRNECEKVGVLRMENTNLTAKLEEVMKTQKMFQVQFNSLNSESSYLKNKLPKCKPTVKPMSPVFNRSLENITGKPFRRKKVERKINSARSHLSVTHSSSDDSLVGGGDPGRTTRNFKFLTKPQASSPTLSDISHNSGFSRCACRNCLHMKYGANGVLELNGPRPSKKLNKGQGRTTLLKRIQSLEKLISGMVLK